MTRNWFKQLPVIGAVVLFGVASLCSAQVPTFTAILSGVNEVPANASLNSGTTSISVDAITGALSWNTVTTIPQVRATGHHIHQQVAGVNGPIVASFGTAYSGTVTLSTALAASIIANPSGFYVNLHTAASPGGEIRGQLIPAESTATMVEYYYSPLDYYFMTSRTGDKAALDTLTGWNRTGKSFKVYTAQQTGTVGLNRYYFDQIAMRNTRGSHFYTLVQSEKEALASLNPTNAQAPRLPYNEGIDSYAFAPAVEGVGGSCTAGQLPVYRIFRGPVRFPDNGNHRFTTDIAIYNSFVALGWDGEGVKLCVPN